MSLSCGSMRRDREAAPSPTRTRRKIPEESLLSDGILRSGRTTCSAGAEQVHQFFL